jgi:hypothetical protein
LYFEFFLYSVVGKERELENDLMDVVAVEKLCQHTLPPLRKRAVE